MLLSKCIQHTINTVVKCTHHTINNLLYTTLAKLGNVHWADALPAIHLTFISSALDVYPYTHFIILHASPPRLPPSHRFSVSTEIKVLQPDPEYVQRLAHILQTFHPKVQSTQQEVTPDKSRNFRWETSLSLTWSVCPSRTGYTSDWSDHARLQKFWTTFKSDTMWMFRVCSHIPNHIKIYLACLPCNHERTPSLTVTLDSINLMRVKHQACSDCFPVGLHPQLKSAPDVPTFIPDQLAAAHVSPEIPPPVTGHDQPDTTKALPSYSSLPFPSE